MMKIRMPQAFLCLILTSSVAFGISPQTSKLEAMYNKAFQAFDSAKYDEALSALDAIDAEQPDLAESLNLRGVVYMRQGKYDRAEVALRKALSLEPRFWNARFNLSQIPFMKKDWPEARNRFEALIAGENQGEMEPETVQLVQYKILLTFVLQGKENMAAWILNKFESAKDSPAHYFSNAAIAYQHGNQKEANEWISAADKRFSSSLTKLYAESFYEVGWMQKPPGEGRSALQITSNAERADHLKANAKANFEKAERAFQQRNFLDADSFLNLAEAGLPNDPKIDNLRGEILLEQKNYDEAEVEFRKAFSADPKFREAQYNLAQVPFKKGNYEQARDRFEALFSETPGDDKNQASQLIKFKVYLTLLLAGKDDQAQQVMDQFKFTGDTPALYYAQAAWEFQHGHRNQGEEWVRSAYKIYSPALNLVFGDSFYDLGWLNKEAENNPATTSSLAQADASPKGAPPAMRLGLANEIRAPSLADAAGAPAAAVPTGSPVAAAGIATGAESPASIVPNASPAPSVVDNAPVVASVPLLVPNASVATAARASVAPATSDSSPPMAKSSVAPVSVTPVTPATSVSKVVTASSQGTQLLPAQESSPFGEIAARFSRPGNLLIVVLLLGTALLVIGLVVSGWRNLAVAHFGHPSPLFGGGPFAEGKPPPEGDLHRPHKLVSTGPPQLSLNLKATEPVSRATGLSSDAVEASAASIGVTGPPTMLPKEFEEEAAIPVPPIALVATKTTEPIVPPMVKPPVSDAVEACGEVGVTEPPATVPKEFEEEAAIPVPSIATVATKTIEPIVPSVVEPPVPESISENTPIEAPTVSPQVEEVLPEELEPAVASLSGSFLAPVPVTPTALEPLSSPQSVTPSEESLIFEPGKTPAEIEEAVAASIQEPVAEEPIGQGQPIPELTTLSPEPVLPEPKPAPKFLKTEGPVTAFIGGHPIQLSIESLLFASKIISTQPTRLQPTTSPMITPETTMTPATGPGYFPSAPTMSVQLPASGMQTTVQVTFSLEIVSMRLTPAFKTSGLQLKPTSKVVSMRFASSQDPQLPVNLQVTFEVGRIDLSNGSIGTVWLSPSSQQRPVVRNSSSFPISGLEFVSSPGGAPVQLTPLQQDQASVHLTAEFQIAAIEFTPQFEVSAIVLNSTSRRVSMQLPGTGPSSIEGVPLFEIENVQLGPGNELGLIQVTPGGGRGA